MSLPTPPDDPSDWAAEIGRVAETLMNATVAFYDPTNMVTVPYDPVTDEGGYEAPALLFTSKARVQSLKAPRDPSDGISFSTKRTIRLQLPISATTMLIRKGLIARVTDGANDPVLTKIGMTVLSAINSSHAALRTVECATELSETDPIPVV